jgi:uncharacterized protein (DUF1015 family)
MRIQPFRAIRPDPNHAAHVASVPYDVVTTEEARELARDEPHSFLHVVRPEIDLTPGIDPHDDAVYEKGRENFQRLLREGALLQEGTPSMFLYRLVLRHRSQIGLVCCCHVGDYENNVIRKHEKTRPDKEDDRTRHVLTTNANTGPVFLTYRDQAAISSLVLDDTNHRPLYHFDSGDGVTHTAWSVPDPQRYADAFAQVDMAYVADGHHRSASAARAAAERRRANPSHTGDEEYNWFLSVLFPANQLDILPYNRVVADLHGQTVDDVRSALSRIGSFTPTDQPQPDRPGVFCIYLDGAWYRLELRDDQINHEHPIESLDVFLLEQHVLGPILGISDVRTDPRIDFVGGVRGTQELERRVDSGQAAIAISMYPTNIEQLLTVADAGLEMPPKSTWFEPKLRSGLFVHGLD